MIATPKSDGVVSIVRELTADDIRWHLEPEDVTPADADLLTAAVIDAASYRMLSQTLLSALHELQRQYDMTTRRQQYLAVDDVNKDREDAYA